MKSIEALIVLSGLLTACGIQASEPPRTWTSERNMTPTPELITPPPTHMAIPATTTVYESPTPNSTLTLFHQPITLPNVTPQASATRIRNPPAWCERTPVLVGTPDISAKTNAYLFGTSFSYWFMSYKRDSSVIQSMYSDIDIKAAAFPGEDMRLLSSHLNALSKDFQVQPNRKHSLALQLSAIGLINGRDPTVVLSETVATTLEIQRCFPEVERIVMITPIINRKQDPTIQLNFAKELKREAAKYGWSIVDINLFLLLPDGIHVDPTKYNDTLHINRPTYEQYGAPAIHAAMIGTP